MTTEGRDETPRTDAPAREAALEEAVKVCEINRYNAEMSGDWPVEAAHKADRDSIRALKGSPNAAPQVEPAGEDQQGGAACGASSGAKGSAATKGDKL